MLSFSQPSIRRVECLRQTCHGDLGVPKAQRVCAAVVKVDDRHVLLVEIACTLKPVLGGGRRIMSVRHGA